VLFVDTIGDPLTNTFTDVVSVDGVIFVISIFNMVGSSFIIILSLFDWIENDGVVGVFVYTSYDILYCVHHISISSLSAVHCFHSWVANVSSMAYFQSHGNVYVMAGVLEVIVSIVLLFFLSNILNTYSDMSGSFSRNVAMILY
jgi:hypothetical protein